MDTAIETMKEREPKRTGRRLLLGRSAAIRNVYGLIERAASVDLPVLIFGETGTGKDLIAREIHDRSERCDKPFVSVNTGSLSPELVASELFGHIKGAFTGATENKSGRFVEANNGTLFLDEITTAEERTQISLLRVLESGALRPVGGDVDRRVDVRLIAATNVRLEDSVMEGRFRADLLHRLGVFAIDMPPLRNRREDIPILANHFLEGLREEFDLQIEGVSEEAMDRLRAYTWPGNIRELKNVIAQAAVMAERGNVDVRHLPERIASVPSPAPQNGSSNGGIRPANGNGMANVASYLDSDCASEGIFIPIGMELKDVELAYMQRTLSLCGNNKSHAARRLGISRKTLIVRLQNARRTAAISA